MQQTQHQWIQCPQSGCISIVQHVTGHDLLDYQHLSWKKATEFVQQSIYGQGYTSTNYPKVSWTVISNTILTLL
jgi:hypothetical protein